MPRVYARSPYPQKYYKKPKPQKTLPLPQDFLDWAAIKGYHQNIAYRQFSPKLKMTQSKVIFLTDEEQAAIREYQIPPTKQYLKRVRDVLVFCCYTGLRYSDVANLRRSDIKDDHIEVTTVKTADSLIIELNKHSRAISQPPRSLCSSLCWSVPTADGGRCRLNVLRLLSAGLSR